MNKDAILASVIGFSVGLLITASIVFGPKLFAQFQTSTREHQGQVASLQTEEDNRQQSTDISSEESLASSLTIDQPTQESIVKESGITVSGNASPNSLVIVGTTEEESVVQVSSSGRYEAKIALKEGKNDISVANVVNDQIFVERVVVYYSQEP